MIIKISGNLDKTNNWILNYDDIDEIVNPLLQRIDHKTLNEIKGLEKPTSENLAKWFWERISKKVVNLESIEIIRPRIGGCIYLGD